MDALPLGIRLNNPGCVRRALGARGPVRMEADFPAFSDMVDGLISQASILHAYYFEHHLTTLPQIIARYAPAAENDVSNYVGAMANLLSYDPSNYATRDVGFGRPYYITQFMLAQHRIECGVCPPDWRAAPHWVSLSEMTEALKATGKWSVI